MASNLPKYTRNRRRLFDFQCTSPQGTYVMLRKKKIQFFKINVVIQFFLSSTNFEQLMFIFGHRGCTVFKVLRYKLEGRWLDSRWCHWNFSLT